MSYRVNPPTAVQSLNTSISPVGLRFEPPAARHTERELFEYELEDSLLTINAFEGLLCWLDSDRNRAAKKYEQIQQKLIQFFWYRGCIDSEGLADRTIDRVASKLPEIRNSYVGDQASYFMGFARNIYCEYCRRSYLPSSAMIASKVEEDDETEARLACLDQCILRLEPADRNLILDYYRQDKRKKIDHRKALADQLGIPLNALRIKIYRLRRILEECMRSCSTRADR